MDFLARDALMTTEHPEDCAWRKWADNLALRAGAGDVAVPQTVAPESSPATPDLSDVDSASDDDASSDDDNHGVFVPPDHN